MKRPLYIAAAVIVSAFIVVPLYCYGLLYSQASNFEGPVTIEIKKGASFAAITRTLVEAGLIESETGFKLAARITGAHRDIKAGEYELLAPLSPMELIRALASGRVKFHSITFPEGYTISDIARELGEQSVVEPEEFSARASDESFIRSLGLEAESLEGYLFPDTYKFTRPWPTDDILTTMTARFKEVYALAAREKGLLPDLTMNEIVTLASMIEKEAGMVEEMGLISAVFHNRLRRRIALASDPTVIYGIKDFNGNLTRRDLRTPTPYNTYLIRGLPPGPIASPGKAVVRLARNRASRGRPTSILSRVTTAPTTSQRASGSTTGRR